MKEIKLIIAIGTGVALFYIILEWAVRMLLQYFGITPYYYLKYLVVLIPMLTVIIYIYANRKTQKSLAHPPDY